MEMSQRIGGRCLTGLVAAGCAVVTVACSGSVAGSGAAGTGTSESPNAASSPVGLSRCMRANGVPNFPDPRPGPGGSLGLTIGRSLGSSTLTVDGVTFSGPAFVHAEKACRKYLPGAGGPPPAPSAAQKARMLANARCMRTHGVPDFPDPTFTGNGGIALNGSGIDPTSPAFQRAAEACKLGVVRVHP